MSLQLLTKEFLSTLSFSIDEKVMSMYYDSLSADQKSNSTFLSELLCNSKGIFLVKRKNVLVIWGCLVSIVKIWELMSGKDG